jgi:hypothetical protein
MKSHKKPVMRRERGRCALAQNSRWKASTPAGPRASPASTGGGRTARGSGRWDALVSREIWAAGSAPPGAPFRLLEGTGSRQGVREVPQKVAYPLSREASVQRDVGARGEAKQVQQRARQRECELV